MSNSKAVYYFRRNVKKQGIIKSNKVVTSANRSRKFVDVMHRDRLNNPKMYDIVNHIRLDKEQSVFSRFL